MTSNLHINEFPRYLYHGTSSVAAKKIMREGIKPTRSSKQKSVWDEHPSRPDCAYLTRAYAPYYAMGAADAHGTQGMVVFEIDTNDLDRRLLLPDEDALEQISRKATKGHPLYFPSSDIAVRTAWYRDNLEALTAEIPQLVDVSINSIGNVCYRGEIPQIAITNKLEVHSAINLIRDWGDPTITIMNYHILGHRYRVKTDKMFNRPSLQRDLDMYAEWEEAKQSAISMRAKNVSR